jgi:hypothetical protein
MIETNTVIRLPKKNGGLPNYVTETPDKSYKENTNPNLPRASEDRVSYVKHTPAKRTENGDTLEEARVISLTPRINQT